MDNPTDTASALDVLIIAIPAIAAIVSAAFNFGLALLNWRTKPTENALAKRALIHAENASKRQSKTLDDMSAMLNSTVLDLNSNVSEIKGMISGPRKAN